MFKLATYTQTNKEGGTERKQIDWDAYHEEMITACGTATKARSIPFVISGIYDLGIQNREPIEQEWNEKDAKREGAEEYQAGGKRMLRIPMKPTHGVAIAVDAPSILVDKGKWFGDASDPKPLRLLLNGEFSIPNGEKRLTVVGRPFWVQHTKMDDGTWAFTKTNNLHKLAEAAGLLDDKGYFTKERIGELLGKPIQCQFRVYMKPSKGKEYYSEEIKLAGMVPEGVPIPDYDQTLLHGVNLVGDNDETAVKQLRASVRNTIKRAINYEGSDIKQLFDFFEAEYAAKREGQPKAEGGSKPAPQPAKVEEQASSGSWEDDEDAPF